MDDRELPEELMHSVRRHELGEAVVTDLYASSTGCIPCGDMSWELADSPPVTVAVDAFRAET